MPVQDQLVSNDIENYPVADLQRACCTDGWPVFRAERSRAVHVHDRHGVKQPDVSVQGVRDGDQRGPTVVRTGRDPVRVHVVQQSKPVGDAPVSGHGVRAAPCIHRDQLLLVNRLDNDAVVHGKVRVHHQHGPHCQLSPDHYLQPMVSRVRRCVQFAPRVDPDLHHRGGCLLCQCIQLVTVRLLRVHHVLLSESSFSYRVSRM